MKLDMKVENRAYSDHGSIFNVRDSSCTQSNDIPPFGNFLRPFGLPALIPRLGSDRVVDQVLVRLRRFQGNESMRRPLSPLREYCNL